MIQRRENPPGIPVSEVGAIAAIFGGALTPYWQLRLTIWKSVWGITQTNKVVSGTTYFYYTSAQEWTLRLKQAKDASCVDNGDHDCPEEAGYGQPDL